MAGTPSIGDILMLSQMAWSVGRAFTSGRMSAPAEFAEVEREAQGLSKALRLLADTFQEDGDVIARANTDLQSGMSTILASAQITLKDLESFVESYQVIRKEKTPGGFVVIKGWSDAVLRNYKIIAWTREKGDIQALRNLLMMHSNTINLTMQALQTKSLSRIERTIMPMASRIEDLHDSIQGRLSSQLDELYRVMTAIASSSPSLKPIQDPSLPAPRVDSLFSSPVMQNNRPKNQKSRLSWEPFERPQTPPRSPFRKPSVGRSNRHAYIDHKGDAFDRGSPPKVIHERQPSASDSDSQSQYSSGEEIDNYFPTVLSAGSSELNPSEPPPRDPRRLRNSEVRRPSPARGESPTLGAFQLPPAFFGDDPLSSPEPTPATPASVMNNRPRQGSSRMTSPLPVLGSSPPESLSPEALFMKQLLRNSAKLFDGHGTLFEVTQFDPEAPDPRYNTKLVEITKSSRIYVIRRRETTENGTPYYATSIWTIADDFSVRVQQKLPEYSETIPFHSFFDPEKISLGQETAIRLHSKTWGAQTLSEINTSWANYHFESPQVANSFQSAIFGRLALDSFKTEKTLVLHEGFKATFAFEEAMCVMERMRIFEEDGVAMPGANGGVMALVHLSASFGEGWLKWWINSSRQRIKVKDEGGRGVKVKGIDVVIAKVGPKGLLERRDSLAGGGSPPLEGGGPKRREEKTQRIKGMKIEFSSEEEKIRFIKLVGRAASNLLPLPDL